MSWGKNNLVWKLLRKNISLPQIIGYSFANLVGLSIVMTAICFYRDIRNVLDKDTGISSEQYLVITKKIGPFGSSDTSFSASEIDSIASQPWVEEVGSFTPAGFNVNASVDFNGSRMSTALFLESVPDNFLDVIPPGWEYAPGDATVPIILSKEYLSLYNFGFASSRGLPVVSEAMLGMIPLRISVSGNGKQEYLDGRIAGFSSRLNSVIVPESFMEWANRSFGENVDARPSRLIIASSEPDSPEVEKYLSVNEYETNRDNSGGKMSWFLSVLTSVVVSVGAIICVLSLFILMLSLFLLLQKNRDKLHNLMSIGYTPGNVASGYRRLVVCVNLSVFAASSVAMFFLSRLWGVHLDSLGIAQASKLPVMAIGLAIISVVTLLNIVAINRTVRGCF